MITKSLDVMLSTPGIWVAHCFAGVLLVEVETDSTCHQLKLQTLERDGVLDRGGWNLDAGMSFLGPLARPKG